MIKEQFYIKDVDNDFLVVTLQFIDGEKFRAFLRLFEDNRNTYRKLKEYATEENSRGFKNEI